MFSMSLFVVDLLLKAKASMCNVLGLVDPGSSECLLRKLADERVFGIVRR